MYVPMSKALHSSLKMSRHQHSNVWEHLMNCNTSWNQHLGRHRFPLEAFPLSQRTQRGHSHWQQHQGTGLMPLPYTLGIIFFLLPTPTQERRTTFSSSATTPPVLTKAEEGSAPCHTISHQPSSSHRVKQLQQSFGKPADELLAHCSHWAASADQSASVLAAYLGTLNSSLSISKRHGVHTQTRGAITIIYRL